MLVIKSDIPVEIIDLAKDREKARKEKDWSKSDSIRDQIIEKGWIIEDTTDGFKLKPLLDK